MRLKLRNIFLPVALLFFALIFSSNASANQITTNESYEGFENIVWSLDLYLMWFGTDNAFNQGGVPAGSVAVRDLDGLRGLHVTNRIDDAHGADMRLQAQYINRLQPGDRVRLTGRVENAENETQIRLLRIPGNDVAGEFPVVYTPKTGQSLKAWHIEKSKTLDKQKTRESKHWTNSF